MICSDFCELLDSYESLTNEQRMDLENHATQCETCRKELEFFKSVINISASIPAPEAPKSLIENVNAKLDAESTTVIGFKWNFRVLSTIAACLAIGLAVGINNEYIKGVMTQPDTDGVITETVITSEEDVSSTDIDEVVSQVSQTPEPKAKVQVAEPVKKAPVVASEPIKPTVKPVVDRVVSRPQYTQIPVNVVATQAPLKEEADKVVSTPVPEKTEVDEPVAKPTTEPEHNVEEYAIKDDGPQIAYGHYNVEPSKRAPSAISDYLHVGSNDMGTVVSTMSEMGVKNSGGYYMTSRQNFYDLIDRLSDEGVGYECDLQYNSGENISFRLTYN